jgi:glutaredoxin-like protein
MSFLPDPIKERLKSQLGNLVNPVRVVMFTQELECTFCAETKQLVIELAGLSDKIKAEVHDFVADSVLAKEYGVDKIPALVIMGEKDYGIKFYGLPYGYEFQAMIADLTMISKGSTDLAEETKAKLREIKTPIHIQVFTSLTCPHCPHAAVMAHKFAMESDLIRADVVDAGEFPHLAQKYSVMGVPKIVINEKVEFVGAVPENVFLDHVLLATR